MLPADCCDWCGVRTTWSGPSAVAAAEPGKAVGSFTFDSTTVPLAYAVETKVEGLFDSSKQDTLVVLTDKPLGATAPSDDIDISLRARKGEIAALMLRIDGAKLVNVSVFHKGLAGKIQLPGAWFDYKAAKPGTGTLKLAPRDFDGKKYGTSVEFAATVHRSPLPWRRRPRRPHPNLRLRRLLPRRSRLRPQRRRSRRHLRCS